MLIEYHRTMLADRVRNAALHAALERVIVPGETTVADIGAGTGLIGFLARRLGAREAFLYEHADVMVLAERLAKTNRIRGLHFFHEHSTNILDPVPVDVVVSETLGNFALEEFIIDTLEDARRFLKPGGIVIPGRLEQFVAPVTSDRFHRELCVWDEVGFGLDFDDAKRMGFNNLYVRQVTPDDLLDGMRSAQRWDRVDFSRRNDRHRRGKVQWTPRAKATVYGFAVWWRCELVPGVDISTAPDAPRTHWDQIYLPLLEPIALARGDALALRLDVLASLEQGIGVRWTAERVGADGKTRQALDIGKGFLG